MNLLKILFEESTDNAIKKLNEACSDAVAVDAPADLGLAIATSYPEVHHDEDGRMMDYGSEKSDSHEGRMTKAKLFRLGQMAQSLHDRMEDGDDLPEWVQDKITTAEDRIQSAHDYIVYKLHRLEN